MKVRQRRKLERKALEAKVEELEDELFRANLILREMRSTPEILEQKKMAWLTRFNQYEWLDQSVADADRQHLTGWDDTKKLEPAKTDAAPA